MSRGEGRGGFCETGVVGPAESDVSSCVSTVTAADTGTVSSDFTGTGPVGVTGAADACCDRTGRSRPFRVATNAAAIFAFLSISHC